MLITKSKVPQCSAYVLLKKSPGTKVIYESDYAMRVLDSRDKGHHVKAREDRKREEGRARLMQSGKDTRIVSLCINFQSVTVFCPSGKDSFIVTVCNSFSLTISWEEVSAKIKSSDFPEL